MDLIDDLFLKVCGYDDRRPSYSKTDTIIYTYNH
jgi:hypothetical protein